MLQNENALKHVTYCFPLAFNENATLTRAELTANRSDKPYLLALFLTALCVKPSQAHCCMSILVVLVLSLWSYFIYLPPAR